MKTKVSSVLMTVMIAGCGSKPTNQVERWLGKSCFDEPDGDPKKVPGLVTSVAPSLQLMTSSVDAIGRIRDRNLLGGFIDIPLKLFGDGTLTNNQFETAVVDGNRAVQKDGQFIFAETDDRFGEVSLFANAVTTVAWFKNMGMRGDISKIGLALVPLVNNSPNNVIFFPPYDSSVSASIRVTKGDGVILQNLRVDRDLIAHELTHAMIYRNVNDISGESLVVHEGLADALTMLRNDDPCFGRTICPAGTNVCSGPAGNQCLRTADNTFTWTDSGNAFYRGQILSGFVWDLRKGSSFKKDELSKVTVRAIEYLNHQTSIVELMSAYFEADRQLFNGVHVEEIKQAAQRRQLPLRN